MTSRVPWVRTPRGAVPLRVRDHVLGVLLGWAGPGLAAFATALVSGPIVRSLPEAVANVAVVVPVGAFFMVAGAITIAPLLLAAAGPPVVRWLLRRGLGGMLPTGGAGALAGAVAAVAVGVVAPGTDPLRLTGIGLVAGILHASAYWCALRLLRPAAFVAPGR